MATRNLSWTARADKDWIEVYPTQGTGNIENLHISVSPITEGDTDNVGNVTLTCTSCGVTTVKTIPVSRCSCKYSLVSSSYREVIVYADACDTSCSVNAIHDDIYEDLTEVCDSFTVTTEETIVMSLEVNQSSEPVEYIDEEHNIKVIQSANDGRCGCPCSSININIGINGIVSVPNTGVTNFSIGTIVPTRDCIRSITIKLVDLNGEESSEGSVSYSSDGNVILNLNENENANSRDFKINITWKADRTDCPANGKEVRTIRQNGANPKMIVYDAPTDMCDDAGTTVTFRVE